MLFITCLLAGSGILQAQTSSFIPGDFYNTFLGSKYGKIVQSNTEIKGSPYENDEFVPGDVITKDRKHYAGKIPHWLQCITFSSPDQKGPASFICFKNFVTFPS